MGQTIRDLMQTDLVQIEADRPITEAARLMRDQDVGDVLVTRAGELAGIVTDRDIVVRCLAAGENPADAKLESVCSAQLATLSPDDDSDEAVRLMEDKAVRRVPVVEGTTPVGIVSIGDLARARDEASALGQISAAPPNR